MNLLATCKVCLAGTDRKYTYKYRDLDLKVGDYVVVPSIREMPFTVGQVVQLDVEPDIDYAADFDYKFVVQIVDVARNQFFEDERKEIRTAVNNSRRRKAVEALKQELGLINLSDLKQVN